MGNKGKIRLIIQIAFAAVSNGYIKGFCTGKIYDGKLKNLCVPGMNCYSCPGALGACPIGSLQAVLSDRQYKMSLYVVGLLFIFGGLFGRFICGFLCPFGLFQDLLHKIPYVKKFDKLPMEKFFRLLKYTILLVMVILLPLFVTDITGLGKPWFCKYICPVGTLEGGIILVMLNEGLRRAIGFLFGWKFTILIILIIGSIIIYRPFCRYLCPLGAIYGLFNQFAIYRYSIDTNDCTECKMCQKACNFDIQVWKNPNHIDCIRCGACIDACPKGCITSSIDTLRANLKKC